MPRKSALLLSLLNLVFKPVSGQTKALSNQPVALPPHPPADDREAWRAYWKAQSQPWRTEPEIDEKRQRELTERGAIVPEIERGIYPFRGMKLSRADVEWLLITLEDGKGPSSWSGEQNLYEQRGLDLRGADLRQVNLNGLPLTRMRGGLDIDERLIATAEQGEMAAVQLQGALLRRAHLEGAQLFKAHLEDVNLFGACLKDAYLRGAHLERADLVMTDLEGAILREAHVEGSDLRRARLEGTNLTKVVLSDERHIGPRLADINWSDANMAGMQWSQVRMLGDEYRAHQQKTDKRMVKGKTQDIHEYEDAVRANRQVATALQVQGLNEEANRFAYRAQILQKRVFGFQMLRKEAKRRQRAQALGAWLFSWFLFLLAGYGYRLWRSFLAYALVIIGFTAAYYLLGASFKPPLSLVNALALSMTSFHGRGFFPGVTQLNDPLTLLASLEAFMGLVLEATFIATLTQRFFGK